MPTPGGACTCACCPPRAWAILTHSWQERLWAERRTYEPCADAGCSCHCGGTATQEDLLCDGCRERGGISAVDEPRIAAFLARAGGPSGRVALAEGP